MVRSLKGVAGAQNSLAQVGSGGGGLVPNQPRKFWRVMSGASPNPGTTLYVRGLKFRNVSGGASLINGAEVNARASGINISSPATAFTVPEGSAAASANVLWALQWEFETPQLINEVAGSARVNAVSVVIAGLLVLSSDDGVNFVQEWLSTNSFTGAFTYTRPT